MAPSISTLRNVSIGALERNSAFISSVALFITTDCSPFNMIGGVDTLGFVSGFTSGVGSAAGGISGFGSTVGGTSGSGLTSGGTTGNLSIVLPFSNIVLQSTQYKSPV